MASEDRNAPFSQTVDVNMGQTETITENKASDHVESTPDLAPNHRQPRSTNEAPEEVSTTEPNGTSSMVPTPVTFACTSIFAYLQNESPTLYHMLSNEHIVPLNKFVADKIGSSGIIARLQLGKFLLDNTLAVASKLFPIVSKTATRNPHYNDFQKQQVMREKDKLEAQTHIEHLLRDRGEETGLGGIAILNGKFVFGPCRPEDTHNEDVKVFTVPQSLMRNEALARWRRAMAEQ